MEGREKDTDSLARSLEANGLIKVVESIGLDAFARHVVEEVSRREQTFVDLVVKGVEEEVLASKEKGKGDDITWTSVLERCISTQGTPQFASFLLAQLLDKNTILVKCSEKDQRSMTRALDMIEQLLLFKSETEWNAAEKTVRFPALMNAFVGMLASEEGGGVTEGGLCEKMASFFLKPDFHDDWLRQKNLCQHMIAMLWQDIQLSTTSLSHPKRAIGVLSAWLLLWVGTKSTLDTLEIWASSVGTFAQFLFGASKWDAVDELALRASFWIRMIEDSHCGLSTSACVNISIALASALRRPADEVVKVVLPSLEQIAGRMPGDALERLCFSPGSAMKQMIARRCLLDLAKRFYLKCADEQALAHDLNRILSGKAKVTVSEESWILFELDLAVERGVAILLQDSVLETLLSFRQAPRVLEGWIDLVLEDENVMLCPGTADKLVQYGLQLALRGVVLPVLSRYGYMVSSALVRRCLLGNSEDWQVRLAALDACSCFETVLACLDDSRSLVRARATEKLGAMQRPVTAKQLARLERWSRQPHQSRLKTQYLHVFFSTVLNRSSNPGIFFEWLEQSSSSLSCFQIDQACAQGLACALVQSKLRTGFGNASATLSKLTAILDAIQTSKSLATKSLERCRLDALAISFIYFLEQGMYNAAEDAGLMREFDTKVKRFFFTNRAVWSEWLTRVRPVCFSNARQTSGELGPEAIWHGLQALREGRSSTVSVVLDLARVLEQRGESDLLADLLQWTTTTEDPTLALAFERIILATAEKSNGAYASAARQFQETFQSLVGQKGAKNAEKDMCSLVQCCVNGALDCFLALSDWECVDEWTSHLEHLQEQAWSTGLDAFADSLAISNPTSLLLSQAQRSFDRADVSGTRHLVSLLENGSPTSALQRSDALVLSSLAGQPIANRSTLLHQLQQDVAHTLQQALQYSASVDCINSIQSRLWFMDALSSERCVDPLSLDKCPLKTLEMLGRIHGVRSRLLHDAIVLAQATVAREQGNLKLASERLVQVFDKGAFNYICEKAFLDAQDSALLVNIGYLQQVVSSVAEESNSLTSLCSAEKLSLLLADLDVDEKRGYHLDQACKLAGASEKNAPGGCDGHRSWLEYGAWARNLSKSRQLHNKQQYHEDEEATRLGIAAAQAFARHITCSSKEAPSRRTVACLQLLELVQEQPAASEVLSSTPPKAWVSLIPQLLTAVSAQPNANHNLQALMVSVAKNAPDRIIWDIFAARQDIPRDLFSQLRQCFPRFDLAERMISDLVNCAVWVEERWFTFLERILGQKDKVIDAIQTLQANQSFDDDTKRDRCLAVMQPTLSALNDLYSATFGSEGGLEGASEDGFEEEEEEEDDDDDEDEDEDTEGGVEGVDELEHTAERRLESRENRKRKAGHTRNKAFQKSMKETISFMERFMQVGIGNAWRALEMEHHRLTRWMKTQQAESRLAEYAPNLLGPEVGRAQLVIPGTENVALVGFVDRVIVLNTKTRPKRLWLRGSDGLQYRFLLKGGEDMRVDQRIMQLGSVVNEMIAAKQASHPHLREAFTAANNFRTFTVVPLSRRVGLVQWIVDAKPFLSIYRDWQSRHPSVAPGHGSEYLAIVHKRVSEEAGQDVQSVSNMAWKDLPVAALKTAFQQTSDSVPSDLLARAIWMRAPDAASWWKRTRHFTRSVAASSMIGHIVGLGDRHLDNILLDMSDGPSSGQVVHIDFAVCFDKGRLLRVPETVPFRLTRVMRGAFPFHNSSQESLVGKQGSFSQWCQLVLGAVRENSELVKSMISSLLHDESIDWMAEGEKGDYFTLDVNVSISLLASEVNLGDAPIDLQLERDASCDTVQALVTEMKSLHEKERKVEFDLSCDKLKASEAENEIVLARDRLQRSTEQIEVAQKQMEHTREELLSEQKLVRTQQGECDRLQAQLANGVIGLQEVHVIERLRNTIFHALTSLVTEDGTSLAQSIRTTDSKDKDLVQAAVNLREKSEKALKALEHLQALVVKYGDLSSYGSNSLVETWLAWFQKARNEVNDTLQVLRGSSNLLDTIKEFLLRECVQFDSSAIVTQGEVDEKAYTAKEFAEQVSKLIGTLEAKVGDNSSIHEMTESLSATSLMEMIQSIASSCVDEKTGWKYAQAIEWYWQQQNSVYERSSSVITAVQARSDVRRALLQSQLELASTVEAFKAVSARWKSSVQDSEVRRRVLNETVSAVKSLSTVLESVTKVEAYSQDLRTVSDSGIGSAAPLDVKFAPLLVRLDQVHRACCESCLLGLRSALESFGYLTAMREKLQGRARAKDLVEELEHDKETISAEISAKLRGLRRAAYLDHVSVWSNISNIRRGADEKGPFHSLATGLIEERNMFLKHHKLKPSENMLEEVRMLANTTRSIRGRLAQLLELAKHSEGDYGKKEDAVEASRRKRRETLSKDVLRRLQAKLDSSSECSDQVFQLTAQAMDAEKLSRMYHGWMPFV